VASATQTALSALTRIHPPLGLDLIYRRARRDDPMLALADRLVRPGDVVVDAGASYGLFTARFARLVGPDGRVHAFEPNPARHAWLRRLARGRPVTVHPIGLSDQRARAGLRIPVIAGRAYEERAQVDMADGGAVRIQLGTLDDALGADRARVALIKCDVEGHEVQLLHGAARTLAEAAPPLLIEIEQRYHAEPIADVFAMLAALGYDGVAITAAGLLPLAEFDVGRHQASRLAEDASSAAYVNNFLFARAGTPGAERTTVAAGFAPATARV
jgi:FkbM family methyltransferase